MIVLAYGLRFSVPDDLPLPGWHDLAGAEVDVRVSRGAVSTETGKRLATTRSGTHDALWIDELADGNLRVETEDGARFEAFAANGVVHFEGSDQQCAATLVGQVLPMVAAMAGHEIFHASAIEVDGFAWLISAPSGTGKTTLAAHLLGAGARLISDDVVALAVNASNLCVLGAGGPLRVASDMLDPVLTAADGILGQAGTDDDKVLLMSAEFVDRAVPLGAVAFLTRSDGSATEIARTAPAPAELLAATFNLAIRTPDRLVRQLEVCHRVAREVPVFRIETGSDPAEAARSMLREMRSR